MHGLMMNMPLTISSLIRHAERHHGDTEIVSRLVEGGIHRYTYADAHRRARQLANALIALGVKPTERIGTLAWNGFRHFELYYAVSGIGAVCHTINPRLFPEQIGYIINHAEDGCVLFDLTFLPLVEKLAPHCKAVRHWIAMTDKAHMPAASSLTLQCYEDLVNSHSDRFEWPDIDENAASSLCYTSGTTGNPKGVLYSHRSTLLHAYGSCLPDALNLSARDAVLPVVPMFHVNAWGLPYSAPLVGAKLVFPGAQLDGASLHELFKQESVTVSAGVPTIWLGLLAHVKGNKLDFGTLKRTVIGGSACPPSFEDDFGVQVLHAWGMTEMSPLGTVNTFKQRHLALPKAERDALQNKQGRVIFGVDMVGPLLIQHGTDAQRTPHLEHEGVEDPETPAGDERGVEDIVVTHDLGGCTRQSRPQTRVGRDRFAGPFDPELAATMGDQVNGPYQVGERRLLPIPTVGGGGDHARQRLAVGAPQCGHGQVLGKQPLGQGRDPDAGLDVHQPPLRGGVGLDGAPRVGQRGALLADDEAEAAV